MALLGGVADRVTDRRVNLPGAKTGARPQAELIDLSARPAAFGVGSTVLRSATDLAFAGRTTAGQDSGQKKENCYSLHGHFLLLKEYHT